MSGNLHNTLTKIQKRYRNYTLLSYMQIALHFRYKFDTKIVLIIIYLTKNKYIYYFIY